MQLNYNVQMQKRHLKLSEGLTEQHEILWHVKVTNPFVCANYRRISRDYGFQLVTDVCFSVISSSTPVLDRCVTLHLKCLKLNMKTVNSQCAKSRRKMGNKTFPHLSRCSEINRSYELWSPPYHRELGAYYWFRLVLHIFSEPQQKLCCLSVNFCWSTKSFKGWKSSFHCLSGWSFYGVIQTIVHMLDGVIEPFSSNWKRTETCILHYSAEAQAIRCEWHKYDEHVFRGKKGVKVLAIFWREHIEIANIFFPQQNDFSGVWWIPPKMDVHCSSLLCFVLLELPSQYSSTTLYSLTLKIKSGGGRGGGSLKNEKSARVGDACPSGIRGTLKHQTEEVILPAGQFENNQCELSRCSF